MWDTLGLKITDTSEFKALPPNKNEPLSLRNVVATLERSERYSDIPTLLAFRIAEVL